MTKARYGVLTMSDKGSRGEREDRSGQVIRDAVLALGGEVAVYEIVPDEKERIQEKLVAWCDERGISLHSFAWRPEHATAGLARDALYLLRPDTYVALAEPSGTPEAVDRYCAERGIQLGARPGR